jgi:hypothetical protein
MCQKECRSYGVGLSTQDAQAQHEKTQDCPKIATRHFSWKISMRPLMIGLMFPWILPFFSRRHPIAMSTLSEQPKSVNN